MSIRTFRFNVVAPSGAPSWFTSAPVNSWIKIGSKVQSSSNPADITRITLPFIGNSAAEFVTGTFDYSGAVVDPVNEQLLVWGGGHSSGWDNGVYAFPLREELNTIRWSRWAHSDFPALAEYVNSASPNNVPWATMYSPQNAGTYAIERYATGAIDVAGVTRTAKDATQRPASYFRGSNVGTGGPGSSHSYQGWCFAPDGSGGHTVWSWGLRGAFDPSPNRNWNTPIGPDSYSVDCLWKVNTVRRASGVASTGSAYAQTSWATSAWDLVKTRAQMIAFGNSYLQGGSANPVYNPVKGHIVNFNTNLANSAVLNHVTPAGVVGQSAAPALTGDLQRMNHAPASYIDRTGTAVTTHQFCGAIANIGTTLTFRLFNMADYAASGSGAVKTISWPAFTASTEAPGLVWHEPSQAFLMYGMTDATGLGGYLWKIAPAIPGNWWGSSWTCTKTTVFGGSPPTSADSTAQLYGRFNILRNFGGGQEDALVYAPHPYGPFFVLKLSSGGV